MNTTLLEAQLKSLEGNEKLRNQIADLKENRIVVYDSNYAKENNIKQVSRGSFIFYISSEAIASLERQINYLVCELFELVRIKHDIWLHPSNNPLYFRIDGVFDLTSNHFKIFEINSLNPALFNDVDTILSSFNSKKCFAKNLNISINQYAKKFAKEKRLLILTSSRYNFVKLDKNQQLNKNVKLVKNVNKKELEKKLNYEKGKFIYGDFIYDQILLIPPTLFVSLTGKRRFSFLEEPDIDKLINPNLTAARLIGSKLLLSEIYEKFKDNKEYEDVIKMIPKTVRLHDLSDKEVDEYLKLKNQYALKIDDTRSGKGVFLGTETSQKKWEELLMDEYRKDPKAMLQERIEFNSLPILLHNENSLSIKTLPVSFDPEVIFDYETGRYKVAAIGARAIDFDVTKELFPTMNRNQIRFNPSDNRKDIYFGVVSQF